jgi:drug/metabolite transporter (DMT)-like permease
MFLKAAGKTLPLGQILLIFGLGGLTAFCVLARRKGQPIWSSDYLSPAILVRSAFEATGRVFYALAFLLIPLSVASAILQATPLVVIASAAVLLGERVGWRRWTAVGVGLCGVLLILRPGLDGFDASAMLAVVGMIGFAGRDVATRVAPKTLSNLQLGICGFGVLTLAGAGLMLWQGGARLPSAVEAAYLVTATCFGVFAYNSLTVAMRTGEVGAVTPWRYTRLVFAMILGIAVFGERPDLLTIIGSVIVVSSGTFALLRARKVASEGLT